MADETKDHGAISNNGTTPASETTPTLHSTTQSQVAEAVVVEEEITLIHPKSPVAVTPPSLPVPTPILSPQTQVQTPQTDIIRILEDVKLPERRDQKGLADRPPIQATTHLPDVTSDVVPSIVMPPPPMPTSVSSVHTLKDDLQGVVRDQKMSVVRAVSLEEDRRVRKEDQETPAVQQRSRRTTSIIFVSLLLFAVSGGAVFGVLTFMRPQKITPSSQMTPSIIFTEQELSFPLDNHSPSELKQALVSARDSSGGSLGSIARILPVVASKNPDETEQNIPATFREFMQGIEANMPDDLLRALGSDFFFGFHTVDENAPLIIIPVASYDRAFAGMLAWEKTLGSDLAPAFTSVPKFITDQNGILTERVFQDLVMRNYDVRALRDDSGEIQLFYSFPTRNILIIAESPYSFTEILSRLQAGRKLQ